MPECYVRGSTIKYLRIPDEVIDLVKEEVVAKGRGRGDGKGRGGPRGRGGRGTGEIQYKGGIKDLQTNRWMKEECEGSLTLR